MLIKHGKVQNDTQLCKIIVTILLLKHLLSLGTWTNMVVQKKRAYSNRSLSCI